jgi:hypothetical protein
MPHYITTVRRDDKRGGQIGAPDPSGVVTLTIVPPGRGHFVHTPGTQIVLVETDVELFPTTETDA